MVAEATTGLVDLFLANAYANINNVAPSASQAQITQAQAEASGTILAWNQARSDFLGIFGVQTDNIMFEAGRVAGGVVRIWWAMHCGSFFQARTFRRLRKLGMKLKNMCFCKEQYTPLQSQSSR